MRIQKKIFLFLFFIGLSSFSFSQRGKDGALTVNTANVIINEYTRVTADAAAGATSITVAASGLNANGRFAASLAPGDLIMIILKLVSWIKFTDYFHLLKKIKIFQTKTLVVI